MFRTFHKLRQIPPNAVNAHLQRTECLWKLNMTYPKTSNIIKINSFIKKQKKLINLWNYSRYLQIEPEDEGIIPRGFVNFIFFDEFRSI